MKQIAHLLRENASRAKLLFDTPFLKRLLYNSAQYIYVGNTMDKMPFQGAINRKHRRCSYLQLITFSLSRYPTESHRGVAIDLSDSGMCMHAPIPLLKGQAIIINGLPASRQKATVKWVKKCGITEIFYKTGLMFSENIEESPEKGERMSSIIEREGGSPASEGKDQISSADQFLPGIEEPSEEEKEECIGSDLKIMHHETLKDNASLELLRGSSILTKAEMIFKEQGGQWNSNSLDLLEKALICFKAAEELKAAGHSEMPVSAALEERIDMAATALDTERPGRTQEILGKTKLKYLGDRIYFRNSHYEFSEKEMAIFGNIFFHYPHIVRSAEILYRVLGEVGKRYVNVVMYEETSPQNVLDEPNEMLCIIEFLEDGTFLLVKNFDGAKSIAESHEAEKLSIQTAGSQTEGTSSYQSREGKEKDDYSYDEGIRRGTMESNEDQAISETTRSIARDAAAPSSRAKLIKKSNPAKAEAEGVTVTHQGSPGKRHKALLVVSITTVVLIMMGVFLISYLSNYISQSEQEVVHKHLSQQTDSTSDRPSPISKPWEEILPGISGTGNSDRIIHDRKQGVPPEKAIRGRIPRNKQKNAPSRRSTTDGKAEKPNLPETKKNSFAPHSRDDL